MPNEKLKIVAVEVHEVKIPFRFSFKHALAERREAHNLIIVVRDDLGNEGLGEILPRPYLTGETIASVWASLRERWIPRVLGLEFTAEENPRQQLEPIFLAADQRRELAAYSGLDVAIYDLWARRFRISGALLLGQDPKRTRGWIRFTCPLGGGGRRSVKWIGRTARLLGFRDFKLKTGRPDDAIRLRAARAAIGAAADLRVDANAGWTEALALQLAPVLKEVGISSIEQPVPAKDLAGMSKIQAETGIAVMADEALCTLADAHALLAAGAAKIWNIRLAKNGGFTGFLHFTRLAEAHGIGRHHGVLVGESPILTAAARACYGCSEFLHFEYGYPWLLLKKNIASGGPGGNWGLSRGFRLSRIGLGVKLRRKVLNALAGKQEIFS